METLQGAQPWDPLTSDVWSPGLGKGGCLWFKVMIPFVCFDRPRTLMLKETDRSWTHPRLFKFEKAEKNCWSILHHRVQEVCRVDF